MIKNAGKLCKEDRVLCGAVLIYFLHKRSVMSLRDSGKNDPDVKYTHNGLTFDSLYRNVYMCENLGSENVSYGILISNYEHKTYMCKCNEDTITNDSDYSVFAKPKSKLCKDLKLSATDALYFIHGFSFD